MTLAAFALVPICYVFMFRTAIGLRIRSCGEHPRAADTVGINVYAVRYASVVTSGALAACGGAFLSIGYVSSFTENMTAGRGFIALAALIFGNWRPFGILGATLLFGFSSALAPQLENVDAWANYSTLFASLPYLLTLIAVAGVIGTLDATCSRWPPIQEAVASRAPATRGPSRRSSSGSRRCSRSRPASSSPTTRRR